MSDNGILPAPACKGLSRKEITSLLDSELIRLRLERRDAYSFWAHEVWLDRYSEHEKRVDFMQFVPFGGPMYTNVGHVEHGEFSFYEVKSCLADLKSGHGLTFEGDNNYLVMPVELFDKYKHHVYENPNGYVATHTRRISFLLYGIGCNGKPTFFESPLSTPYRVARERAASELLFCMMRAMIANSNHADVNHRISKEVKHERQRP